MNYPFPALRIFIEKVDYLSKMCTNGRFVTNRYTGQQFWSKCGKCKSCLQERASMRSQRIRNEYDGVTPIYFITLTYDRLSCPYFDINDYLAIRDKGYGELPIYRKHSIRWSVNKQKYVRTWNKVELCRVPIELNSYDNKYLPFLKKQPNCIGVCYFKDLQDFEKRLRITLYRQGYEEKIRLFNVSEYGGKSLRPHYHLLLWTKIPFEVVHDAVIKSWSFGVRVRDPKSCELVTDDPAGYVSSYVNSGEKLPSVLARYFKSKHSASKYFGHGLRAFSLEEIEKKADSGVINYVSRRVTNNGEKIFDFPLPKYVINRYFPIFKGYSRLTRSAFLDFVSSNFDATRLRGFARYYDLENPKYKIDYNFNKCEVDKIIVRLRHAYEYWKQFHSDAPPSLYALQHCRVWDAWKSTCYKYFRMDDTIPDFYKFDNLCFRSEMEQKEFYLSSCPSTMPFVVDNNEKPHIKAQTAKMSNMYDRYTKQKSITNAILSMDGFGF